MEQLLNTSDRGTIVRNWVDEYSGALLSWAYHKTKDHQVAEDLVQDTFLAALQSFEKFRGASEPKTWLFSILNNKIVDHYRKSIKRKEIGHNDMLSFFDEEGHWRKEAMPKPWNENEELLDNPEFRQTLNQCMKKLPPFWLQIVQLKYLEQKDGREICQEIQITSSNFWQIIHRAKLQLRKCIEKAWFNL